MATERFLTTFTVLQITIVNPYLLPYSTNLLQTYCVKVVHKAYISDTVLLRPHLPCSGSWKLLHVLSHHLYQLSAKSQLLVYCTRCCVHSNSVRHELELVLDHPRIFQFSRDSLSITVGLTQALLFMIILCLLVPLDHPTVLLHCFRATNDT